MAVRGKRVNIVGLKDAIRVLERVGGADVVEEIEDVFAEGAALVEEEYRRRAAAHATDKPHTLIWKRFGIKRVLQPGAVSKAVRSQESRWKHPRAWAAVTGTLVGPAAKFLEFGTAHSRPFPHFRRAIAARRNEVKVLVISGIGRIYNRLLLSPRGGE